ncbi:esterase-like activity of phytase family protein [Luteipulveratus halotolerans]|uniref:esterase-like activity of phytase family protein n=1 Tax=Luteipulveratus halotolerans TaxID=1631356 RepID=UPI0006807062|nr:esterase-like activity of phytase family protein [Luteipulveratus halotolerans]
MSRRTALVAVAALACASAAVPAASARPHHGHDDPRAAVRTYSQDVGPLATIGGVRIDGAAYGSSFTAKPGARNTFYGLTDRGPNVDGPDKVKVEPVPDFTPAIGEFVLRGGKAVLVRKITLKAADGTPFNGQVISPGGTGETIVGLDGKALPASPYGYDPEGLAAMRDGSFWVSDEYGPFITHFSRDGREIERLSPFGHGLPGELAEREPNKGMEGLTVTPDGRTLVGIMQAGLNAPDGPKSKTVPFTRIVTIDLRTRAVRQYVYLLHTTAKGVTTANSEISAISNHELLVDERDGAMQPGADKKLYKVDLRKATDVSSARSVKGSTYDAAKGGLLIDGTSLESVVGQASTTEADAALRGVGVRPVRSELFLDVAGLVSAIDPTGGFFGHDKVEGVAVLDHGRRLVISNDSDFGIDGLANDTAPFQLKAKTLPNGQQDTGELLDVDMRKVPHQFR